MYITAGKIIALTIWKQWQILYSWAPKSLQMGTANMKLKDTCSSEKSYDKPRQHKRHYFVDKGPYSQSYGFSSSHVGCKSWTIKKAEHWNWCFWIVVLEKTLESPLNCKETQPVHPKGNQPWIFMGRTGAESEALILWPPDAKSQLIGKDPDAGQDWRQNKKVLAEYEMIR